MIMLNRELTRQLLKGGRMANLETIDALGRAMGDTALRAAVNYMKANGATLVAADYERFANCVKRHAMAAMDAGLADAKAAFDCGMGQIATLTLSASFTQAGIAGAKEFLKGDAN
jgi:hypothetical protein